MKRKALSAVIIRHISSMEKHCHRLPGSFDPEDMHDLRVNYKKTRAFLRLLQVDKESGDLQVPDKLKAVYQNGGKVRDLQLFLAQLQAMEVAPALPVCIAHWNRQLFAYKEQTVRSIEAVHFKKLLGDITKELPTHLHNDTLNKFIQRKVAAIHLVLLAADNEKDLHTIRKQLKDLIYVSRIYESEWEIPFPVNNWKSEKELSDLADTLGDFNDRCLEVSLLQSGCSNDCGDEEKYKLQQLQKNCLQQKEIQQQQLLQQVQALKMEHAF
jgi:CHAD domain-containing protein